MQEMALTNRQASRNTRLQLAPALNDMPTPLGDPAVTGASAMTRLACGFAHGQALHHLAMLVGDFSRLAP
jgi:hypothetical protein